MCELVGDNISSISIRTYEGEASWLVESKVWQERGELDDYH